jgi:hypothetical protein
MSCIVEARTDAEAARRALLAHPAVWGASLLSPREGPYRAWTLELAVVTDGTDADGWSPAHQRTAAHHGLTVREVQRRAPGETRVVCTL